MERTEIVAALHAANEAVLDGEGVAGTGFWRAVDAVKSSPELIEEFADRIAAIDQRAFENWAILVIPPQVGTPLAMLATAIGVTGIVLGYQLPEPGNWVAFALGAGILIVAVHGLGHLVVGRLQGMRFTHWFVGSVRRPQPGIKVDYATYLRTPPRQRAWMHASGALATKAVPFLLIPVALGARLPSWLPWSLAALGVVMVVSDAVWSVKASDWKRFRREMGYV